MTGLGLSFRVESSGYIKAAFLITLTVAVFGGGSYAMLHYIFAPPSNQLTPAELRQLIHTDPVQFALHAHTNQPYYFAVKTDQNYGHQSTFPELTHISPELIAQYDHRIIYVPGTLRNDPDYENLKADTARYAAVFNSTMLLAIEQSRLSHTPE